MSYMHIDNWDFTLTAPDNLLFKYIAGNVVPDDWLSKLLWRFIKIRIVLEWAEIRTDEDNVTIDTEDDVEVGYFGHTQPRCEYDQTGQCADSGYCSDSCMSNAEIASQPF